MKIQRLIEDHIKSLGYELISPLARPLTGISRDVIPVYRQAGEKEIMPFAYVIVRDELLHIYSNVHHPSHKDFNVAHVAGYQRQWEIADPNLDIMGKVTEGLTNALLYLK